MSALTISAVSNLTNQLTITAHGLNTGDGPAAVFAGSGGAIPGGLAPVTNYWVIKIDANTIQLASSSANAMSNTAIDITSNGTLPLSLLVGIPYRRATTYAAGVQVKSADLDAFEDTFTALWNLLTGQAQSLWPSQIPASMIPSITETLVLPLSDAQQYNVVSGTTPTLTLAAATNGSFWQSTTGQWGVVLGLPLKPGDTLTNVELEIKAGAASHSLNITLYAIDGAGTTTIVASLVTTATSVSGTIYTVDLNMAFAALGVSSQTLLSSTAIDGTKSYMVGIVAQTSDALLGVKMTRMRQA